MVSDWDAPRDKAPVEREVAPHRGRRNTRRWCRGKPGVEHAPAVVLDRHVESLRNVRPDARLCRWGTMWRRGGLTIGWSCSHQVRCDACGKILDYLVERERCPDFTPRPLGPTLCECTHEIAKHSGGWGDGCDLCGCTRWRWVDEVR